MLGFFLNCKKAKTVDIKVEGVLFNNGYRPPLMGLEETLNQSDTLGYPPVIKTFLEAAIEHKKKLAEESRRRAENTLDVSSLP